MPHLPQQRDRLHPSEALLNSFPFFLADLISAVSRGPSINGATPTPLSVLCYVRRHVHVPAFRHEISGVVALVAAYGDPLSARNLFQHDQRGIALGSPIDLEYFCRYDQSVAVFRQ